MSRSSSKVNTQLGTVHDKPVNVPFLVALNPPHIAAITGPHHDRTGRAFRGLKLKESNKKTLHRNWSEPKPILARIYPVKSIMPAIQNVDVVGVFERSPLETSYHELRTHEDIFDQIQGMAYKPYGLNEAIFNSPYSPLHAEKVKPLFIAGVPGSGLPLPRLLPTKRCPRRRSKTSNKQ